MELVIKIPNEMWERVKDGYVPLGISKYLMNGTPLPKGHGELIDRKLVLSDDGLCEFHMYDDYVKMRNYLKSIPTIIEAESEDDEE